MTNESSKGVLYAAAAYTAWGLFPLFFKQLGHVGAMEVVAHRTVWSLLFVMGVLLAMRHFSWMRALLGKPKVLGAFALSAVLLACNWLVYVWAVQNDHVLDASLGYFINPLVNVALGFLVLHERPRKLQWLAVGLAAAGVLWLTIQGGRLPWVALTQAFSFGFYGLLRKIAPLGALEGLTVETLVLAPIAIGALAWWSWQGHSAFVTGDGFTLTLLLLSGPLTAITLLLFASGARRIPMTTLGLLQYIAPTTQFFLGVWIYHEPFQPARLIGFALIWLALAVYSLESLWTSRRPALQAA